MRRNQKVNFILLGLLTFGSLPAWSQKSYKYKADIEKIDSNGVYKIALKPDFISKSNSKEFYDIRIVDERGNFVAYAVVNNPSDKLKPVFIDFPEVKQSLKSDTITYYVAENKGKLKVSQLWLKLKNTAVSRSADISGSDDLHSWFAIKENIQLQDAGSGNNPEYEQMLSFPTSDYQYFRIQISNKNKALIKITSSGLYTDDRANGLTFLPLPAVKITSQTINKQTSYFADLGGNYLVNDLKLDISSPKYYNRHISIYDVGSKGEEKLYDDTISSSAAKDISISGKTNKLRIDIPNGDDNPLTIIGISAFQLEEFAVSYLEKGHAYYLLTGDTVVNEVSYDLSFLHSKPLSQFPVIGHSAVYKNPAYTLPKPATKGNFTVLLWLAIIAVLTLLSVLTWKMVKELNPGQGN